MIIDTFSQIILKKQRILTGVRA